MKVNSLISQLTAWADALDANRSNNCTVVSVTGQEDLASLIREAIQVIDLEGQYAQR